MCARLSCSAVMLASNATGVGLLPPRQVVTKVDTRWKTRTLTQTDDRF